LVDRNVQTNSGGKITTMKRILLSFFWMLSLTFEAYASESPKILAKIPFDMVGTYVVLKVKINDNPTLNLLLDSGIGTTLITELTPSDSIVFDRSYKTILKGLGSGSDIQAWVSEGNTLKIGKYKLKNQTVMVLEADIFNLSKHTGSKINGILGADFFENQIVQVDYTRKCIYLYDTTSFRPPKRFIALPISMEGYKMFIEVPIQDASGTIHTVRMLIDTGAELTAWFRSYGWDPVPVPSRYIRGYIGRGLSGDIMGSLGILSNIWVGDYQLTNPIVAFPDSLSISGTNINAQRDGTVGSQLLSRFDLIFDQKSYNMYVKPNYLFKKPFPYNMAGVEVIQNTEIYQLPEVLNVWENSPGQEAGIQAGDFILEINGTNGFKITINEIKNIFETRSKSTIQLILLRNGKTINVKMKLKNVLQDTNVGN
jgi:hypothetical protein